MKKKSYQIKFRKAMLLVFLLTGDFLFVFGQMAVTLPPTPEAQSLMKAVNMQVNKSTGIAGVSVPLYNAGDGGMTVPVTLSYACAAIKVQDIASWVGTGWNLSAGGKITRVMMDNDDLKGGYCRGQGTLANDLASWWSGGSLKEERKDRHSQKIGIPIITIFCSGCLTFDGEPDLFYYEIAGRNGMFVFDNTGKAWTIPYSNLNIELKSDNTFVITDESGVKYSFTLTETTTQISHSDRPHSGISDSPYGTESKIQDYTSTWHLTEIRSLYGEQVNFTYTKGSQIAYENNNYTRINNDAVEDVSVYFKTTPYYLNEITWDGGKLQFVSSEGRADMAGSRRLNEIKLYAPQSVYRKSVKFTYGQFASNRLRLDKIEETAGTQVVTLGKYEYYTDCNMPGRNSRDIDHWGYYNGRNNSSWFPADGADRSPYWPYMRANLLKKAYTNMGGYTEYEYEANSLSNGNMVGGIRIKSVKTNDDNGHSQTVTYSYSGGTSFNTCTIYSNQMGGAVLKYSYSTLNLHDVGGSNVYYGEVTENLPNGSKVISRYTTYADSESNDVKSMDHINPNEGAPNPDISLFPNSSRFWRRGLLKEEVQKDAAGAEVARIVNTYRFPATPKKQIKGFFEYTTQTSLGNEISHIVVYDWLSEPVFLTQETVSGRNSLNMVKNIVHDTEYCLPVEETTTYQNGDVYKKMIRYPFSYSSRVNASGVVEENAIDLLLSIGLKNIPIEQLQYKNGVITGGVLVTYQRLQTGVNSWVPVLAKQKVLQALPVDSSGFMGGFRNSSGLFVHDSRYVTEKTFDSYDSKGRALSWHDENGISQSVVYQEYGQEPIASVVNAKYATPQLGIGRDSISMEFDPMIPCEFSLSIPSEVVCSVRMVTPVMESVLSQQYLLYWDVLTTSGRVVYTGVRNSSNRNITFTTNLNPGDYIIEFRAFDLPTQREVAPIVTFDLSYLAFTANNNIRNNQVFYTGFEYTGFGVVPAGKAKTGEKAAYCWVLTIPLKNMLAGNYTLSYWKSTDNGNSWEYVETPLQITSSSLEYTIGNSSFLIDEVRLIPQNATLSSCTYISGIGKTSVTDANGQTLYYEYDSLGRLVRELDNERKTIKEYEYFINFK